LAQLRHQQSVSGLFLSCFFVTPKGIQHPAGNYNGRLTRGTDRRLFASECQPAHNDAPSEVL
jgi:hypothetical protein